MTRAEREEMWSERIAVQAASGLPGRMWCEREGGRQLLELHAVATSAGRLGGERSGERRLRFLRVLPAEADGSGVRIRIGGALIEVGAGFDLGVLRRVVEALR